MEDQVIEQPLFSCKLVHIFKVPPRPAAGGHKSGDWKISDKIFDGQLRVIGIGDICEVRILDPTNGDLFALCPVRAGQRLTCVEPVSDSSRYFVMRVEDPRTKRHAFLGLGFDNRSESFDFNVSLTDYERMLTRAQGIQHMKGQKEGDGFDNQDEQLDESEQGNGEIYKGRSQEDEAAQALYRKEDMRFKEGETIKVDIKNKPNKDGGFLSRQIQNSKTGMKLPGSLGGQFANLSPVLGSGSSGKQQDNRGKQIEQSKNSWTDFK